MALLFLALHKPLPMQKKGLDRRRDGNALMVCLYSVAVAMEIAHKQPYMPNSDLKCQ